MNDDLMKKYNRSDIAKLPDSTGAVLVNYVARQLTIPTDSNICLAISKMSKETIKSIIGSLLTT